MNIDMSFCQNKFTKKFLEEDFCQKMNGDPWVFNNPEDGFTTRYFQI
jgi:hypothetical protein